MAYSRTWVATRLFSRLKENVDGPEAGTNVEGPCWEWRGGCDDDGYGRITIPVLHSVRTHRVAYRLLRGPVPDGLQLDHLCRNRACCNPAHLEPVTSRENILRGKGLAARQVKRTHCPQGHPYSGNNLKMNAGRRNCRVCACEATRRYRARKKAGL